MLAIPDRFPAAQGDLGAATLSVAARLMLGSRLIFDGRLDPVLLRRAVRLMLDAEPVLGCMTMRERLTTGEWIRCADLDGAETFATAETDDPETDVLAFYETDLDPSAPRLAVRLFRDPMHDEVVVKFDHMTGDGFSAKQIAYMLAETYSRLAEDVAYVPSPNLAPRPSYRDIWAAMTPEQRTAAGMGTPRFAPARWKIALDRGDGRGMFERRLELAPSRLRAVKEYGRARGATLNDMLLTAMFRSLAAIYPTAGVPFNASVTVDGRKPADLPAFHRPSNLSLVGFVEVPSEGCGTFDETLAAVVATIAPSKARWWGIKEACSAGPNYRLMRGLMRFFMWMFGRLETSQPISMNIGILDEARLGFAGTRPTSAYILGSTTRSRGLAFTTSTYREHMTIWLGCDRSLLDPALAERVLAGMDAEFASAVHDLGVPHGAEPVPAMPL